MKSIIAAARTEEFIRLRIGIQPEHTVTDSKRFVLETIPRAMRDELEEVLERSEQALLAVLTDGIDKAMALYN